MFSLFFPPHSLSFSVLLKGKSWQSSSIWTKIILSILDDAKIYHGQECLYACRKIVSIQCFALQGCFSIHGIKNQSEHKLTCLQFNLLMIFFRLSVVLENLINKFEQRPEIFIQSMHALDYFDFFKSSFVPYTLPFSTHSMCTY